MGIVFFFCVIGFFFFFYCHLLFCLEIEEGEGGWEVYVGLGVFLILGCCYFLFLMFGY